MSKEFRKWHEEFKAKNQVVFGLSSEFKECWDSAQEPIQILHNRLNEVAGDWQVNQLKLARLELANKKLREVASSAQFFADEVRARSNDSFLVTASSSLKSDAEDALDTVYDALALEQWFIAEVNRREDTTFLNPRCSKCGWNHDPEGKCLTL